MSETNSASETKNAAETPVHEQFAVRAAKRERLREEGWDPYPVSVPVTTTIAAVRELLNSGQTPPPNYGKRCKACSLVEICQPELLGKRDRRVGYVAGIFEE